MNKVDAEGEDESVEERSILRCRFDYDPNVPRVPFHQYIIQRMKLFSTRVAMVDAVTKVEWNFAEVVDAAERLAAVLQTRYALVKGQVVALALPNSGEFVVSLLAVSMCGAVTTLVNPVYTTGELDHISRTTRPTLWICMAELLERMNNVIGGAGIGDSETAGKLIVSSIVLDGAKGHQHKSRCHQNCWHKIVESEERELFISPLPFDVDNDLATLPFSSGTTGLPKGVMITHRNMVTWFCQFRMWCLENAETDVSFGIMSMYHQAGCLRALGVLSLGCRLIVMAKFRFTDMLQAIQDYKINIVPAVPPVAIMLSKLPVVDEYDLSSVRAILVAGAPLGKDTFKKLIDKFGWMVTQAYGLTETTLTILFTHPRNDVEFDQTKLGSVGRVMPFQQVKVIDTDCGVALGPEQVGEICVRGPMIMKGYLDNPSATAETIDSFGWLHTGDLGYYDQDGWFYIVGRLKELIKYKGYQVAPAELEQILLRHPEVTDAAVVGIPDEVAGELPRAFVVKRSGSLTTEVDITDFLNDKVSPYKHLRGGVVFVSSIPKTGSGKILRRHLPSSTRIDLIPTCDGREAIMAK